MTRPSTPRTRILARVAAFVLALAVCAGAGWQAGRAVGPNGVSGGFSSGGSVGHQH